MDLNINTSDSEFLNQPVRDKKVSKKEMEDGYILVEKGVKILKWVDIAGNWQEKEII